MDYVELGLLIVEKLEEIVKEDFERQALEENKRLREELKSLYPGYDVIIDQLLDNNVPIDGDGNVSLLNEDGEVIAEANMLFPVQKIAIDPVDSDSAKAFVDNNYRVINSKEFNLNVFKQMI